MRCGAAAVAFELIVALPDGAAVFARGMHTFEPYILSRQLPQKIMEENTLLELYRLPRAFRLEDSACTRSHSSGSMMAGWLFST